MMEIIIIGLLGALAAVLANQNIAVFNDGLRPISGQYVDKKIDRKALGATSFALSFGLVIGFGIPVSIGASILLIHSVLLGTDIIGTIFPDGKKGLIIAAICGALYGILLVVGLEGLVTAFGKLPYDFTGSLGMVGGPVVIAFSVFPAIAVGMQHGFKKGSITFGLSFITYIIVSTFGKISINEDITISLSAEGITLIVGMGLLLFYSLQIKGTGNQNEQLMNIFSQKVIRIKKFKFVLAIMGGLVAAATSLLIVAGDPVSLNLISAENYNEATLAIVARALGFIPLVFSTAIVAGVYGPVGTTLVFAAGTVFVGNPVAAFVVGFGLMLIEILLLNSAAKGLDRFPGIRDMGEHIRTSMNNVLTLALLIGGAIACNAIAPTFGYFWLIGLYSLNQVSKKPIVDLAVGPLAAITLGIIVNILVLFNLFTPPVLG